MPRHGVVFKEYDSASEALSEMTYEETKRVIETGESKVAVLVERMTRDHVVTDKEILEAFEAFADYNHNSVERR
ncbi:MAG: hypothetical protein AB1649_27250 [Chloroflexota bacterium]